MGTATFHMVSFLTSLYNIVSYHPISKCFGYFVINKKKLVFKGGQELAFEDYEILVKNKLGQVMEV